MQCDMNASALQSGPFRVVAAIAYVNGTGVCVVLPPSDAGIMTCRRHDYVRMLTLLLYKHPVATAVCRAIVGNKIFLLQKRKSFVNIKTFSTFANGFGMNMQKKIFSILIVFILCALACNAAARRFTLVIDAGHGGRDAGAVGTFSKEKDINLKTALAFGRYVEKNCPDVNVIYTRKTDVFVTLHGRADIANKAKADLFISIHTNSLPSKRLARGMETYTLGMHRAADNFDVAKRENSVILVEQDYKEHYQGFDPNSAESYIIFELLQDNNMSKSVEMAKQVQKNVCATASRPDKGVKQAGFLVLRETSMPSCLIELGFISTPDEERLLNDNNAIDNIARGIYKAFVAYRGMYDDNVKPSYVAEENSQPVIQDVVPDKNKKKSTKTIEGGQPKVATVEKTSGKDTQTEETVTQNAETEPATVKDDGKPVFKLQIFVAERVLKANDPRLKGQTDAQYYKEGGMIKYTLGSSTDYNELYRLRKNMAEKFPGCFIIAFKNGEKMNINEAIKEFKANR